MRINKFILLTCLLTMLASAAHAAGKKRPVHESQVIFEASSPELVVTILKARPGTGQDPEAGLYMQISLKKGPHKVTSYDISHKPYGNSIYGKPQIDFAYNSQGQSIILFQCRYGGDGDHSENMLKVFLLESGHVQLLADQNLDQAEVIKSNGVLTKIKGVFVGTLCDVCDGWEVSELDDIFYVPLVLELDDQLVKRVNLTDKARNELLSRLDDRIEHNTKEQLTYGNKGYPDYAAKVRKEILTLLDDQ